MGRIVASLFLAFVLAISPLPVDAVAGIAFADGDTGAPATAAYVAEEFDVIQDRVTYTCETAVDGTAEITCIAAEIGVTKVSVPASIEHEGLAYKVTSLRFSGGTTAEDVEQLLLPDTLEKLSGWYFSKFVKVKELCIPGSIKDFSCMLQNAKALEKLTFDEGVEEISAGSMVSGCSNLLEINLPSTLKLISGNATFTNAKSLKSIEFPEGVAFSDTIVSVLSDCTSLTSVSLPASLTKVPASMFSGCTSLKSVSAAGAIDSIGDSAFRDCSSLTDIDFQGTLTSIGSSAFQGCASLERVPDLSSVTTMGSSVFQECKKLRASVNLSSLESIPSYAFCYAPVKVVGFCDNLKSIDKWAFIWSTIAAPFPNTLEKIGDYAFFAGTLPEHLVIPDSVTSIGASVFSNTHGVQDVTIGSGLTQIPAGLFDDSSVKSITIDNSMDDITGLENLPSSGVEVTYTRESIDDSVGDTVSSDSAQTLQEAINAAPDGEETVISLKKHVKLSSTLKVPAGKKIKITSDDPYTISAIKSGFSGLVDVAEGASLEIFGKVSLCGSYSKGAIVSSRGSVVLSGDAVVCHGVATSVNTGIINLSGNNASFVMTGGVIERCELDDVYCGVVHAANGAKVVMKGGVIRNNRVAPGDSAGNYLSSTGVMLMGNASFDMSGGRIEGNTGYQGSAVVMYSEDNNQRASFKMTGGKIADNKSAKLGNRTPSGAVHVEGNAEFAMEDGEIAGNAAASDGGKGGGVCVVDHGLQNGGKDHTAFTMKGGSISGNSASAGGGIYTYSDDVTLSAGEIKGNAAWNMGGGVYSEGNEYLVYSTLHIENALVVGNHASKQGGGMWFCPTGDAKVYVQDGGLIAGNTADEAGDDVVFTGSEGAKYKLTLADRAPGGGKVLWYRDGGLFNPDGTIAATNPDVPRFVEGGNNGEPLSFTDATPNIALKSVMSDEVYNLGSGQTSLTITGNEAPHGGGIGANGGVIIGKSENSSILVQKVWENPRIPHPEEVTINLKNGETVIDSITLNEGNGWRGAFSNLPRRDASGAEIKYSVEEDKVDGYDSAVSGDAQGSFTVTNTSTAKVDVPVEKKWVGPAAEKATVRLLAGGADSGRSVELTEANGWKGTFSGLPKYDAKTGAEIEYAVEEDKVDGYDSAITGDAHDGFTVTNTSTATVDVPVSKKWVGPAADKAVVRLLAGGADSGKSVELNEGNAWRGAFEGLPKYDAKTGAEIEYAVEEDKVDGYDSAVTGDAQAGFTVTNTSTATVDVPVEKKWVGPAAGEVAVSLKRGDEVVRTMKLNAENEWKGAFSGLPKYDSQTGEEIAYSLAEEPVEGYDSAVTGDAQAGFTVTNTSTATVNVPVEKKWVGPAAEKAVVRLLAGGADSGRSVELTEGNGWKASFEGLPKYDAKTGAEIEYAVEEDKVDGYDSAITGDAQSGFTVTNTSTATVNVPVEKKWVGPAAEKATVRLLAGGADSGKSVELSDANGWKASFEGLPKYDASGAEIAYTVKEDAVDGYDSAITGDAHDGFTVTNTSTATVNVPVEKKWVGPAAEKATVRLLAGGQDAGKSLELNEANGWKASFEGLPKYDASGSEIEYTVEEDAVDGYDSAVEPDGRGGFTVTNTSTAKVDVPVEKKWVGPAADKATVRLLAGGTDSGRSLELSDANGWKASFEGLPKYDASGAEIAYAVAEDAVDGYDSAVSGDAEHGFTVTNTSTAKVDVPVEKKWVGSAAEKATVRLLAGGADSGRSVELTEGNGWKASFEGLPKYDAKTGAEIEYAVEEDKVDGYDSAITGDAHDGFTVTNTYVGETGGPSSGAAGNGNTGNNGTGNSAVLASTGDTGIVAAAVLAATALVSLATALLARGSTALGRRRKQG
ncbi:Cna B-type domain-containing protein [Senegalimassilia anaerobia]|uniref:Cna B-type domain-containing protein n=1 Tax=Senegalimassilia anaerobia TaxID=1473216 RepID=UPI003A978471